EKGSIQGVEAVIDKDRSGLKLAQQVEADTFMMLTDVSNVCVNFGKPKDRKSTRLNSSHVSISYAVFCLKKKKKKTKYSKKNSCRSRHTIYDIHKHRERANQTA